MLAVISSLAVGLAYHRLYGWLERTVALPREHDGFMDHDDSDHSQDPLTLRPLTEADCMELLSTTTVGRVAFVDNEGVQLLPLNFAVIDDEIYFRTASDSTLHQLAEGSDDVAFEIDHHEAVSPVGWNVTVKGSTSRVSDPELHDARHGVGATPTVGRRRTR